MGIGAGISALGSLGASLFQQSGDSKAASAEAAAAAQAAAFSRQVYGDAQSNLSPYMATGSSANALLNSQLPSLSQGFSPTQSSLEQTPGYQFDLTQGLKSTQNGAAARGLGVSGAALKGASKYATGLADNTLQTQFNIDQGNKTNAYTKLIGTSTLGDTAASQLGSIGNSAAANASNAILTGAQGQASANIAAGTAFNPLLNNAGSYYMTANYSNPGSAFQSNASSDAAQDLDEYGVGSGNALLNGVSRGFRSIF